MTPPIQPPEPTVVLEELTEDQREGLACIRCGARTGSMRPILTPHNPQSAMVFIHVDPCGDDQ